MKKLRELSIGLVFLVILGLLLLFMSNQNASSPIPQPTSTLRPIDPTQRVVALKNPNQSVAFKNFITSIGAKIAQSLPEEGLYEVHLQANKLDQQLDAIHKSPLIATSEIDIPHQDIVDSAAVTRAVTHDLIANNPEHIPWGVEKIGAPEVWGVTSGQGVRVAIFDNGLYDHPEFSTAHIVKTYNFVDNTTDVSQDDDHGTEMTGIIAAQKNNFGIIGAAYNVNLYIAKIWGKQDDLFNLMRALAWARQNKIQVINMSFIVGSSPILKQEIKKTLDTGTVIVAGVGNDYGVPPGCPACWGKEFNNLIAVGATNINDQEYHFKFDIKYKNGNVYHYNFGSASGMEVMAPGVSIETTTGNHAYVTWHGTSQATAHVTAAAALLVSLQEANVELCLEDTAKKLGESAPNDKFGFGRINILKAVNSGVY